MRRGALAFPRALALAAALAAGCEPPEASSQTGTVVGSTAVAIDTRIATVRDGEAAVADFITDTLRAATTAMGYDVEVALINAGAIRGGAVLPNSVPVDVSAKLGRIYPPGPLTDLDLAGWVPFRDDLVVLTVTGAQLKSALERGASQLPPDLRIDGGGPFLQLSGGRYTIDCAGDVQLLDDGAGTIVREGSRISRLEAGGVVLFDRDAGIDVLATTNVRLVVNSFVAGGGDGHFALTGASDAVDLPYDLFSPIDALVAAVAAGSPIAPATDGRITVIGDCGMPLSQP
jgi:5'-nucleotidase / UDP-sugar diphosphatase